MRCASVSPEVVVPKEVREALGLKPGSILDVQIVDGKVVMVPQTSYTSRLFGKHRSLWQGEEAVDYIRSQRESWCD